jgi:hypothetical protein
LSTSFSSNSSSAGGSSTSSGSMKVTSTSTPPRAASSSSSVQVIIRLRPLNEREKKHGTLPVVSASTLDKSVTVIKGGKGSTGKSKQTFKFDNVFTSFSTQEDIFEATLQPIIRDVLNGYESTVFAYGQVCIYCYVC